MLVGELLRTGPIGQFDQAPLEQVRHRGRSLEQPQRVELADPTSEISRMADSTDTSEPVQEPPSPVRGLIQLNDRSTNGRERVRATTIGVGTVPAPALMAVPAHSCRDHFARVLIEGHGGDPRSLQRVICHVQTVSSAPADPVDSPIGRVELTVASRQRRRRRGRPRRGRIGGVARLHEHGRRFVADRDVGPPGIREGRRDLRCPARCPIHRLELEFTTGRSWVTGPTKRAVAASVGAVASPVEVGESYGDPRATTRPTVKSSGLPGWPRFPISGPRPLFGICDIVLSLNQIESSIWISSADI